MPRCSNCGKVNRDGAMFCQECGTRIVADAPAPPAAVRPCPQCGTVNAPGMRFCKMCGTPQEGVVQAAGPGAAAQGGSPRPSPLPPPPGAMQGGMSGMGAVLPAAAQAPAKQTCGACGAQTPMGFAFCQQCGQRLAPGTPVAGVPQTGGALGSVARAGAGAGPSQPGVPAAAGPGHDPFAPTIAPRGAPMQAPHLVPSQPTVRPPGPVPAPPRIGGVGGKKATDTIPAPSPGVSDAAFGATMIGDSASMGLPAPPRSTPPAVAAPPAPEPIVPELHEVGEEDDDGVFRGSPTIATSGARLVSMRRDGSDGEEFRLLDNQMDIGRTEGAVRFGDDPFLAARHARIEQRDGRYVVVPLDRTNGVYLRLREGVALQDLDQFLVGQQVFRYEVPGAAEAPGGPVAQHGIHLFGTPLKAPWGRLCQIGANGTVRDVYHLERPQYVLGRTEGDLLFPEDDFLSRRHAVLMSDGTGGRLDDLGSSNGTYLRLREPRTLSDGDQVRLGDQVLRFEG